MAKKEVKPVFDFAFGKENYILMLVGVAVIFLGFILMTGGGSDDPTVWDSSVFSTRRVTVAPLLVIAGFVIEVFAIVRKPKD
ncbi:MAG: hypothetical protein RL213_1956 [Bacteroidota bacterium]|jgi:uncharacterized membrane protein